MYMYSIVYQQKPYSSHQLIVFGEGTTKLRGCKNYPYITMGKWFDHSCFEHASQPVYGEPTWGASLNSQYVYVLWHCLHLCNGYSCVDASREL